MRPCVNGPTCFRRLFVTNASLADSAAAARESHPRQAPARSTEWIQVDEILDRLHTALTAPAAPTAVLHNTHTAPTTYTHRPYRPHAFLSSKR